VQGAPPVDVVRAHRWQLAIRTGLGVAAFVMIDHTAQRADQLPGVLERRTCFAGKRRLISKESNSRWPGQQAAANRSRPISPGPSGSKVWLV